MTGELVAISLTVVAHWAGAVVLIVHLWRSSTADDGPPDGRGGDWYDGEEWHPRPSPPSGGVGGFPLPDAEPAAQRLRDEHDRVADPRRRPTRRVPHPRPAPHPSSPVSSSSSSSA